MSEALYYDPIAHQYYLGSVAVPSVTQILDSAGFVSDFAKDDAASKFGTILHCHVKYVLTDTWPAGYHDWFKNESDEFKLWHTGIVKFVSEQQPEPYISASRGIERILFHTRYCYAGQLDFFGKIKLFGDRLCLIDWKSWGRGAEGATKHSVALGGLQTAGYDLMLREYEKIHESIVRLIVHFFPDGYRIYQCKDIADEATFLSALNCYKWKKKHN